MVEVSNDLGVINAKLSELFDGASLIKFSYSGIYTLEFDHPGSGMAGRAFSLISELPFQSQRSTVINY
jgi:hypothetical protein